MVDLHGADTGNILPLGLRSPEIGENYAAEDAENHPTIINTQIATYNVLIDNLQRRIDRLQARNEKLEKLCELAKNYSYDTNAEAENQIVELNNSIASETKKINDNKKKCDEIESMRNEQRLKYVEAVELLEEKFERTRIRLYAEIKTINAKINAIEDFKLTSESLKAKYDDQNQSILQKEEEMQQALKQIEYKSIEHKENLKKEAYKKILEVSEKFQLELKHTVPQTTQRLMRETIILENELVRLWNDYANMEQGSSNHEYNMEQLAEEIKEAKINKINYIKSIKVQNVALKKLNSTIVKMDMLKPLQTFESSEQKSLRLSEIMRNPKFLNKDYCRRKLEIACHQKNLKYTLANELKTETSAALKKCQDVLTLIKRIVYSAISINNRNVHVDVKNMDLSTFAYYLLDLIDDYTSKKSIFDSESSETESDLTHVYPESDLDLGPVRQIGKEHIDQEIEFIESTPAPRISTDSKELEKSMAQRDSLLSQKTTSTDISASSDIELTKKKRKESMDIRHKEMEIMVEDEYEDSYSKYEMQDVYEDFLNYKQE